MSFSGIRPCLLVALSVLCSLSVVVPMQAQDESAVARGLIVPVDDPAYQYIERLQRRGHLLELNPTALPYSRGDIADALGSVDREVLDIVAHRWVQLLSHRIGFDEDGRRRLRVGGEAQTGMRVTTTDRLDVLRPFGDDEPLQQFIRLRAYFAEGPWAAQVGVTHDRQYLIDPDGVSAVLRLQARNEDNYVGVDTRYASLYLGRFGHHWGQHGQAALVLSDNPRSYDGISFRLGSDRLSLRSIVGELDAMQPDSTFDGRASQPGSVRRFITAHRIDWRLRPNIVLTFMESVLYSGVSSGLSLKFFNPLQLALFANDNQPKNDNNRAMVAGNLWMQFGRFTINGQILLDDADIMGQTQEPISAALSGSAVAAGVVPRVDVGVDAELVTARTYNTHDFEGQYLFLNRGLATNFSDYVRLGAFADIYADDIVRGLRVSPRVDYLEQGEFDMRLKFPANVGPVGTILSGVVERTMRASIPTYFQPSTRFWLSIDPGINFTRNADHVEGVSRTRFVGMMSFGVRIPVD